MLECFGVIITICWVIGRLRPVSGLMAIKI
jgi:small subunit ribosomal protein S15